MKQIGQSIGPKVMIAFFTLLLVLPGLVVSALNDASSSSVDEVHSSSAGDAAIYLPVTLKYGPTATPIPSPTPVTCQVPGASFERIPVKGAPDKKRDDVDHADLNLAVRSYEEVDEFQGLIHYNGATDSGAPQLAGLFADGRTPNVIKTYAVYDWDWGTGQQGALLSTWPVTLMGLETSEGELIHLPDRNGGDIYQGRFKAIVIYASSHFITLKYTREDDVVQGYTIHIENVCVDADLVTLYRQGDDEGRTQLPALAAGQAFGVALGNEVRVAIRDVGSFMDPRSRKDWWVGHPLTTPTATPTVASTATPTVTLTMTPTVTSTMTPTVTSTMTPTP